LDYCIGLCLVHSLAGGTGSGLGLRLAEDAVEELDLCLRLTFSVTPHRYGDAPLQSYNSLLTLGRLTQLSESVVLLQNDWLLTQLNCRLPRNRVASSLPTTDSSVMAQTGITVDEMNRLAAEQMMNLLAPCDELASDGNTVQADGVRSVHAEPLALSHSLTALSEARFIRIISESAQSLNFKKSSRSTSPYRAKSRMHVLNIHHIFFHGCGERNGTDWDHLEHLLPTKLRCCPIDATWNLEKPGQRTGCRPLGTLAALLVYRGRLTGLTNSRTRDSDDGVPKESARTGQPTASSLQRLHDYMRPVRWNSSPFDHWYESRPTAMENSVTLAFNSYCITEDLNCLLYRAQMRRNMKAYLHWYEKFGCTQDTFDAAVEQLRDVVRGYEELAR
ncbi:hypothetical protein T265_14250, partial [Opisthorchis viverrini]